MKDIDLFLGDVITCDLLQEVSKKSWYLLAGEWHPSHKKTLKVNPFFKEFLKNNKDYTFYLEIPHKTILHDFESGSKKFTPSKISKSQYENYGSPIKSQRFLSYSKIYNSESSQKNEGIKIMSEQKQLVTKNIEDLFTSIDENNQYGILEDKSKTQELSDRLTYLLNKENSIYDNKFIDKMTKFCPTKELHLTQINLEPKSNF